MKKIINTYFPFLKPNGKWKQSCISSSYGSMKYFELSFLYEKLNSKYIVLVLLRSVLM